MSSVEKNLLGVLGETTRSPYYEAKARQLALMWPSLAAHLADFMAAHDQQAPTAWRRAAAILRAEGDVDD